MSGIIASNSNNKTGIIYCAKNKITNKYYIGQTIKTLEQRIKEHYRNTTKRACKFGHALNKYDKNDWEWSILEKNIPSNELNDREIFYISKLDTFKAGYNSNEGGGGRGVGSLSKNKPVYELWHPDYGVIKENISELSKRSAAFNHKMGSLLKGEINQINGYVLLKNKDNYDNIINKSKYVTLTHEKIGTLTLRRSDFIATYNLNKSELSKVIAGKTKSCKGWRVIS